MAKGDKLVAPAKAAAPAKGAAPVKAAAPAKAAAVPAKKGAAAKKITFHQQHAHLFASAKRDYRIGRDIPPTRNLTRFVKWPRYVRLQRQRAILKRRLKVPPSINHFTKTLDQNQATTLFKLMAHYRPESKKEKKDRLLNAAKAEVKHQEQDPSKKPRTVKYGLNHITTLVENKKAKLVVIAHDVDPLELVVWLPALCRKMEVPYVIVKGKARLGAVVHKKTASALAFTEVKKEHSAQLNQFIENTRSMYSDAAAASRKWGGGVMGNKAQVKVMKREKALARERAVVNKA